MTDVLLLFDIDGTLLSETPWHREALRETIEHTFAVKLAADAVERTAPAGKTDRLIAREMLRQAGVAVSPGDARWEPWCELAAREAHRHCPTDLRASVIAGAADGVERMALAGHRLALLTGNLEPIAWLKLQRAGLAGWFEPGQGAFGSDHEDRKRLPGLARLRAGGCPPHETVVIGDTPRDIACARAAGVWAVAAATGAYAEADLQAADTTVTSLTELPSAVRYLS